MHESSFVKKHLLQTVVLVVFLNILVVHLKSAQAAPVDPLTGSTPTLDTAPEEGTDYNSGDWGISEQNGAAIYTFPINVPAGRNGMAPSLSLRYSSNSPLRGGLAVGWGFHIPSVEKDLSLGVTVKERYKIDLGSTSGRLVEAPEQSPYPNGKAYRVQFDNSYTRIFSSNPGSGQEGISRWIALTPDGIRHNFEEPRNSDHKDVWPITSQVDSFGNTVRYIWSDLFNANGDYIGQSLTRIEYTANGSAGLIPHAKIEFEYTPLKFCLDTNTSTTPATAIISDIPIGAAYRKGSKQVTGAQQLAAIKIHVRDEQKNDSGGPAEWRLSKVFDLTYLQQHSILYETPPVLAGGTTNSGTNRPGLDGISHATPIDLVVGDPDKPLPPQYFRCKQTPLRYLTKIDVEAFDAKGIGTSVPPIKFQYNHRIDTSRNLSASFPPKKHLPEVSVKVPAFGQEGISGAKLGGLKKTLLDINNDGIRDSVSVIVENKVCTLIWRKGLLGGAFAAEAQKSALPTAAWYRQWRGFSNEAPLEGKEGCSLSGQTAYRSGEVRQPDLPDGTHLPLKNTYLKGIVSFHFMDYTGDGRLDLITSLWASSNCVLSYEPTPKRFNSSGDCAFDQDEEPEAPISALHLDLKPEKEHLFIWRVYPGMDNPEHPFLPNFPIIEDRIIVSSPLPLPLPASEDEYDSNTYTIYNVPVLFDLDGDGFLDIIASKMEANLGCGNLILLKTCDWSIYFGNGTDQFKDAQEWVVPKITLAADTWTLGTQGLSGQYIQSRPRVIKLLDINSDGLADLVVQHEDAKLYSYRNMGAGFDIDAHPINGNTALEEVKTDLDAFIAGQITDGDRGFLRRMVDLDGDGLLDMVWFEGSHRITSTVRVKAKFNLGDRFGNEVNLLFPKKWAKAKNLFSVGLNTKFTGSWKIATDFTDVNGDGLADLALWHPSTFVVNTAGLSVAPSVSLDGIVKTYVSSPGLPSAPDLLKKVTNGRGMELAFSYAPSTDRSVVPWAEGSVSPRVAWVVKQIKVKGGHDTPVVTTQYQYQTPKYGSAGVQSGLKERSKFVGFLKNIKTTHYANGTSKEIHKHYVYIGFHGVLVKIQAFRDGQLHRVVKKKWEQKTLFDEIDLEANDLEANVHVLLPIKTETCTANGSNANETDCFAQNEHVHRIEKEWKKDDSCHQFLSSHQIEGVGVSDDADDLRTSYAYDIRCKNVANPEDYRVRVRETMQAVSGALSSFNTLVGHSKTEFNIETGLPSKVHDFFDTDVVAKTGYFYDAMTGNLLRTQKHLQSLANGGTNTFTEFSYDSHQLFVHETTNELGHQLKTTYDTATGALTQREGPNSVTLESQKKFNRERWEIDGFGRVLSRSISFDQQVNNDADYVEHPVERFFYNDMNFVESGQPVSSRVERLRDIGGQLWIPIDMDFDGMGRVLQSHQLFNGDMTTHTVYKYADSGGVLSIETPDPSDESNRSAHIYSYDGLGRVTHLQRPDDSGISVAYAGLVKTISEVAPDNTGGAKTERSDVFGRLMELEEHDGLTSAITRYQYDTVGNLKKITDAENNITTMDHDWQGNRTAIHRGERHWIFQYDLNGNLTAKQSPAPTEDDIPQYTTSYMYDDLDRVKTKSFVDMRVSVPPSSSTIPPAGAMNSIHYNYDEGDNGIGRLSQVDLPPFGVVKYGYDARGLIVTERRSFTLNETANMNASQQVTRAYNALGQLTKSEWQDNQQWSVSYDERGLVDRVEWYDDQADAWKLVADFERDLIGLPSTRTTDYGQTRDFTYDVMGRPSIDNVSSNAATIAHREYSYTDSSDLSHVTGHTNGISAKAQYTYDKLHRLTDAQAPNGYLGSFTYSPTGNVLSGNVSWNNSAQTRDVSYSYGQVDAQAVDRLQDVASGDSFAAFAYDTAGNMTWRSAPDGDTLLHRDGQDQIRRADTSGGTETYYYDHMGQRMLAVNPAHGVRFWFGERETRYELDGAEIHNYLHLSAGGPALARVESGANIELQYSDALQNLMFSLDKDGTVLASFMYGPFGEVVFQQGGSEHRRQFNGKENDAATGLRYYGYRYYDPLTLRWNSADPLYVLVPDLGQSQPQRMNLYAFTLNNPVRYYDPDGRDANDDESDGETIEESNSEICKANPDSSACIHENVYGPNGGPNGGTSNNDPDTDNGENKPKDINLFPWQKLPQEKSLLDLSRTPPTSTTPTTKSPGKNGANSITGTRVKDENVVADFLDGILGKGRTSLGQSLEDALTKAYETELRIDQENDSSLSSGSGELLTGPKLDVKDIIKYGGKGYDKVRDFIDEKVRIKFFNPIN